MSWDIIKRPGPPGKFDQSKVYLTTAARPGNKKKGGAPMYRLTIGSDVFRGLKWAAGSSVLVYWGKSSDFGQIKIEQAVAGVPHTVTLAQRKNGHRVLTISYGPDTLSWEWLETIPLVFQTRRNSHDDQFLQVKLPPEFFNVDQAEAAE